jgi:hypothetical protein
MCAGKRTNDVNFKAPFRLIRHLLSPQILHDILLVDDCPQARAQEACDAVACPFPLVEKIPLPASNKNAIFIIVLTNK